MTPATPPATTWDKLHELVAEVRRMDPRDAGDSHRGLIEMVQIMAGIGYDPLELLLPDSPAEADAMVDGLIALLFQIRGDDLPPFDLERHMADETAMDG